MIFFQSPQSQRYAGVTRDRIGMAEGLHICPGLLNTHYLCYFVRGTNHAEWSVLVCAQICASTCHAVVSPRQRQHCVAATLRQPLQCHCRTAHAAALPAGCMPNAALLCSGCYINSGTATYCRCELQSVTTEAATTWPSPHSALHLSQMCHSVAQPLMIISAN